MFRSTDSRFPQHAERRYINNQLLAIDSENNTNLRNVNFDWTWNTEAANINFTDYGQIQRPVNEDDSNVLDPASFDFGEFAQSSVCTLCLIRDLQTYSSS